MRADNSIKFPYKIYRNILCPIITLEISQIGIDAYVDSGAFYSIFSIQEADLIGIDYKKGKQGGALVGDGNIIPVYFHYLPIIIGNISVKAMIGFSPRLGIGFNLLGRKDIFERFIVIFDDVKKTITFLPRKQK